MALNILPAQQFFGADNNIFVEMKGGNAGYCVFFAEAGAEPIYLIEEYGKCP